MWYTLNIIKKGAVIMAKLNRNREPELEEEEYEEYDEEMEDDDEDDEEESSGPFSNPLVKYGAMAGVLLVLIVGAVLVRGFTSKPVEPAVEQTTSSSEEKKDEKPVEVPKDKPTTPTVEPKGKDEASATRSLERPEAPLSGEDTKSISDKLVEAINKLKDNKDGVNNQSTGLFLTESGVFNLVRTLVGAGYTPDADSVKAYKSDNDNVQQFTINLKKDGAKPITLTGNWAPAISQFGLVQVHGEIPNLGSSDGGQQSDNEAVKNDTDKPEDWKKKNN